MIDESAIKSCHAVLCLDQLRAFEGLRETLTGKHQATPGKFKKDDWRSLPDFRQRLVFLEHLRDYRERFEWNERKKVLSKSFFFFLLLLILESSSPKL
jgi:hypothetical protein